MMRAFWISVLALAVLAACCALNYGFVSRFADSMELLLQALPDTLPSDASDTSLADTVRAPADFLALRRDLLSLTVPLPALRSLEDAASDLIVSFEVRERASYASALSHLRDALDAFRDTEIFHWLGIF